jgi:hypothetical protein
MYLSPRRCGAVAIRCCGSVVPWSRGDAEPWRCITVVLCRCGSEVPWSHVPARMWYQAAQAPRAHGDVVTRSSGYQGNVELNEHSTGQLPAPSFIPSPAFPPPRNCPRTGAGFARRCSRLDHSRSRAQVSRRIPGRQRSFSCSVSVRSRCGVKPVATCFNAFS